MDLRDLVMIAVGILLTLGFQYLRGKVKLDPSIKEGKQVSWLLRLPFKLQRDFLWSRIQQDDDIRIINPMPAKVAGKTETLTLQPGKYDVVKTVEVDKVRKLQVIGRKDTARNVYTIEYYSPDWEYVG